METKANHLVIGAFVLGVIALGFGFVYWIQSYGAAGGTKQYYVLFRGSVSGLTTASKVLFNGVRVGRVSSIGIDPDDSQRVRVLITVAKDTPVKVDSRASKESLGLTGGSVIQLTAGGPGQPLLVASEEGNIPVIEAEYAADASLLESAPEIMGSAKTLLRQLNDVVAENRNSIRTTLANVENFTTMLNERSDDIDTVIRDARQLTADLRRMSTKIEETVDKISSYVSNDGESFLAQASAAAKSFKQLAEKLDKSIGDSADGLARFAKDGLKEFELFMRDGRRAARTMDRVLERIERNPQSFLFGGETVPEYNPTQQ
ncbi:MAG: MCE family protein [Alphaproteobacteria bacterium]|nr:MAG: MCE family protein [Alphaproteobacteria bacterium]